MDPRARPSGGCGHWALEGCGAFTASVDGRDGRRQGGGEERVGGGWRVLSEASPNTISSSISWPSGLPRDVTVVNSKMLRRL